MQLSQLVTSLETSQKLKALGVEQKSLFYWVQICNDEWWKEPVFNKYYLQYGKEPRDSFTNVQNPISAFLSAELWEILPLFEVRKKWPDYYRSYSSLLKNDDCFMSDEENMAESMWKLLIYLKENNLV